MPTQLPRAQVILQPEVHSAIKQLAQFDRRTISAMCAELLTAALQLPKYRGMLEEAKVSHGEIEAIPDPRKARKQEHRPSSMEEFLKEAAKKYGMELTTTTIKHSRNQENNPIDATEIYRENLRRLGPEASEAELLSIPKKPAVTAGSKNTRAKEGEDGKRMNFTKYYEVLLAEKRSEERQKALLDANTPKTKSKTDAKGYLVKDSYGKVLLEEEPTVIETDNVNEQRAKEAKLAEWMSKDMVEGIAELTPERLSDLQGILKSLEKLKA